MSEQTQEWTPDIVVMMGVNKGSVAYAIADAHNAAVAAEREMANQRVGEQVRASYEISKQLREQLDAERKKHDEMLLAIVTAKVDLVKVKQELAAERERNKAQEGKDR
jgi:hypothetical protein